jgi:glycosyltransferase involved in cell wall biosynthesis
VRVALVEPYFGGSHRAWAEGYARHAVHEVVIFSLPPVFWKWRMQGGHVLLSQQLEDHVAEHGPFDVVLATSMVNVPALMGHARHVLGSTPVVLYMHENQLTYPLSPLDREDLTYSMINWTSMAAADRVLFNSRFHHDAWFAALPEFLGRFPDERHTHLIDEVALRSDVLPVGVELSPLDAIPRFRRTRPLVVWNQRWEYDKGPAEFAAAVRSLLDSRIDFAVALAGERYGEEPSEFTAMRDVLGNRLVHDSYGDVAEYRELLRSTDVVVSTARQEFFGIAITEAVYAGAFPLLPNRLVYPERIPVAHHASCLYQDAGDLVRKLSQALTDRDEAAKVAGALKPVMAECDWSRLAPVYDTILADVAT